MLDAVFLSALCRELSLVAIGMKLDKIQQPERDMLLLGMSASGLRRRLLISARQGSARVHFTEHKFEQPQNPPMFCMLLRKHLLGARLAGITQPHLDRVLIFEFNTYDDMGFFEIKKLIVEMMGRNSNIILCAADGRIIDCVRRVDAEMSERRQVLPGLFYALPPRSESKPDFFTLGDSDLESRFRLCRSDEKADEWLVKSFFGLSPLIGRELCHRVSGEVSPRFFEIPGGSAALFQECKVFRDMVSKGNFTPLMLLEDGIPKDFTFMDTRQYENRLAKEAYPDFCCLLEAYYTRREKHENAKRRSSSLTKTVKTARDRAARRLSLQRLDLEKTSGRDELRRFGELISANIYRLSKGMESFTTEDYYREDAKEIVIKLDPQKTPPQNAEAYFREYNKAKRAEEKLVRQIELGESQLQYLDSVLEELSRAEGEGDISEIRAELAETGYIKSVTAKKKDKSPKPGPLRFVSDSGLEILVGRNNRQNDELTHKHALRGDIWLHAQRIHGSHVVIRCAGADADEDALYKAASLAVYYSQARDAGKVPVDYTRVKNVSKPKGALPGMVIYKDFKTIIV